MTIKIELWEYEDRYRAFAVEANGRQLLSGVGWGDTPWIDLDKLRVEAEQYRCEEATDPEVWRDAVQVTEWFGMKPPTRGEHLSARISWWWKEHKPEWLRG